MIVVAAQLILEQATGERCFVDLPSGKQTGHPEYLRVFVLCGIVLCRENSIMQLGVGDLMDKRGNSLRLGHAYHICHSSEHHPEAGPLAVIFQDYRGVIVLTGALGEAVCQQYAPVIEQSGRHLTVKLFALAFKETIAFP